MTKEIIYSEPGFLANAYILFAPDSLALTARAILTRRNYPTGVPKPAYLNRAGRA